MKERPLILIGDDKPRDSLSFKQGTIGQAFIASLRTGDLILYTRPDYPLRPAKYVLSELQKAANTAESEHIGLVYRDPHHSYPYILEIDMRGEPQLVNFEDRILHSNCKDILVRTLHIPRMGDFERRSQEWIGEKLDEITLRGARQRAREAYQKGDKDAMKNHLPEASDVTTATAVCDSETSKSFPFTNALASAGNMILVWWNSRNAERTGAPIRRLLTPAQLAKQAGASNDEKVDEEDAFFQDAPLLTNDPTAFISTPVARNAEFSNVLKQYRSTQKRLLRQLELAELEVKNAENVAAGRPLENLPAGKKHLDGAFDPEIVSMLHQRKSFLEPRVKKLYTQIYKDTQGKLVASAGLVKEEYWNEFIVSELPLASQHQ